MAGGKTSRVAAGAAPIEGEARKGASRKKDPDWARGLKQFYDQVVDEPLPDSFMDLLSQLDDDGSK